MLTNLPPITNNNVGMREESRAFGVASWVIYCLSFVFALLLRAQFGDDCFQPNHSAWEIRLHRILFAIVLVGFVIALAGCFRDRPKIFSLAAAVSGPLLLIFEGAMQGCE